jgi:NagD protein
LYFIDVQGTLIDDKHREPIEGSIELIDELNSSNTPYIVVTNNTKQKSEEFLSYLNSLGFKIDKENYLDPLQTLSEIGTEELLAFGTPDFLSILEESGYKINSKKPEAVLLGVKKDYSSDEFAEAIEAVLEFSPKLIGMHGTSIYAKDGRRYPGVGAILKMIEFSTGSTSSVIGKPSKIFYEKALQKIQNRYKSSIDFSDITMISDDLQGDLVGAKEMGMRTVFVLSGKYRVAEEIVPKIPEAMRPDRVENSVNAIYQELKS